MSGLRRIVIMGAGGRDFHNFNVLYRHRSDVRVVAFTAAQIPYQNNRIYPPALAGENYPRGIPIVGEECLADLLRRESVDEVVFAYSDVAHGQVMDIASRVVAAGCDFLLVGAEQTMLKASLPVISVCAVRTGCGKSPVTRFLCRNLQQAGQRPVVVRHPMAYGKLEERAAQSFRGFADLDRYMCTLEEREEFEPLVRLGVPLFAGVDYQAVLQAAQACGDVLIWDGGNNDTPFYRPDLEIVLVDPFRVGDELTYYPGLINLLRARIVLVAKTRGVPSENLTRMRRNIASRNDRCLVVMGDLDVRIENPVAVRGKSVLVVEDGPTLTHGGMKFGAGIVAARRFGAARIVDPRPYAVGSLRQVFDTYPHLDRVLPAMGYSAQQMADLTRTMASVPCDLILCATPVDLRRLITSATPILPVSYEFKEQTEGQLLHAVKGVLQ
jgi:predicted GTPase